MSIIALIDADILVYKSAFSAERQCYKAVFSNGREKDFDTQYKKAELNSFLLGKGFDKEEYSIEGYKTHIEPKWAIARARKKLSMILSETGATDYILYLSSNDKSNFRFERAVTPGPNGLGYKKGRGEKPYYYQLIRDYFEEDSNCQIISNMEADDALGIAQCTMEEDTILCTQDKDLHMIPGKHYNFVDKEFFTSDDPGEVWLSKTAGGRRKIRGTGICWFYAQMLLGDNCDNIPGVPMYGPVKVEKLLRGITQESELIDKVWSIYYTKFKDKAKDRFLEVADLLWMLRDKGEYKSIFLQNYLQEVYNV